MVCGIDTYHDAGQRKESRAGFVSSINQHCTRWYSRTCLQPPGEELVNGLKICFTASLRKYYEVRISMNADQRMCVVFLHRFYGVGTRNAVYRHVICSFIRTSIRAYIPPQNV